MNSMCLHVLCLSQNAPPLPCFNHINSSVSHASLFISLSILHFSSLFLRMRNPSCLKREFLKKWMMGLEIYTTSNKNMTVTQRKNAIKLSADIALASSRNCATRWSQALIAATSVDDGSRLVADVLLGWTINPKITRIMWSSGKIVKRSRRVQRMRRKCKKPAAELIARKLVRRRRKVLRGLVPGGEFMDEISLIEETLDYISALQAQVDVMRCLATAYIASSSS